MKQNKSGSRINILYTDLQNTSDNSNINALNYLDPHVKFIVNSPTPTLTPTTTPNYDSIEDVRTAFFLNAMFMNQTKKEYELQDFGKWIINNRKVCKSIN
jgi:hypothetical protein